MYRKRTITNAKCWGLCNWLPYRSIHNRELIDTRYLSGIISLWWDVYSFMKINKHPLIHELKKSTESRQILGIISQSLVGSSIYRLFYIHFYYTTLSLTTDFNYSTFNPFMCFVVINCLLQSYYLRNNFKWFHL